MKFLIKIMLLFYVCIQTAWAAQIVLDAGHGGRDPGAVGKVNGKTYYEKDIALDITKHTQRELLAKGYDVAMTRTKDTYEGLDKRRAQNIFLCEKLLLSIHADAHDNPHAKGGTALYHPTVKHSRKAAEVFRHAIQSKRVTRSQKVRVLRNGNPECASVLVEVGFMSNPDDLKQLANPQHRRVLGKKLASAAAQYVGAPRKSSKKAAKPAKAAPAKTSNTAAKATASSRETAPAAKATKAVLTPQNVKVANTKVAQNKKDVKDVKAVKAVKDVKKDVKDVKSKNVVKTEDKSIKKSVKVS